MKVLYSKKSKKKHLNKKFLKNYWRNLFNEDYVEKLVSKKEEKALTKEASRLKNVKMKGLLKRKKDGFVYVQIPNTFINSFFSLLNEEGAEKPPYETTGAHISVIKSEESDKLEKIQEIGEEIEFSLGKVYSTNPEGWEEMERVWFVQIESKRLEHIRQKYGLSKKLNGHEFHITFAVKKK